MVTDRNPQAEQMADESMVRNLAAQAECIWPQERELVRAYGLAPDARVLDVGCGTGEITLRLAEELPEATLVGVDVHADHLVPARERARPFKERVEFREGDAFELDFADDTFDLAVCRHLLQAIPDPERVTAEMARVTRPGGHLHLVAEDYGMMHFAPVDLDTDRFWQDGPITFAERTGSDLRSGRKLFTALSRQGLADVRVDYVTVDTVRCPREAFARIWVAWRDGYADAIAENTRFSLEEVRAHFDTMIEAIRREDGYGVWHLPVVSARVPG
jgi:SAM-dependent methyltransferase